MLEGGNKSGEVMWPESQQQQEVKGMGWRYVVAEGLREELLNVLGFWLTKRGACCLIPEFRGRINGCL